jgi:ABC-type nickel/cobalt efflux system permease component RcnA
MFGLDELLGGLARGHGAAAVVVIAFVLGLRHAADPDHLVAVSTLVAGTREPAVRTAARLGAAWGLGHAMTMLAFGIPVVVLRTFLPHVVEQTAEVLIGAIIVLLAVRLLIKWRQGAFHVHVHDHDGDRHAHVHAHAHDVSHGHGHAVRSPAQAFSIGLVHGLAGSGGVAVLIVAAVPERRLAILALVLLALGTAVSMTALSALVGRVFGVAAYRRAFGAALPGLGAAACVFGLWYAAAALVAG